MCQAAAESPATDVTVRLTPEQSHTIAEMAQARGMTAETFVAEAIETFLRERRHRGPGHTRDDLHRMMAQSPLANIADPDSMWDESKLDRAFRWPTDSEGRPLIDAVNFAVIEPAKAYMTAAFEQDSRPPYHWRAWLEPATEELGELGDLPECSYPRKSFTDACQALYEAYAERYQ